MKYQRQIDLLQYISEKGNCRIDELLQEFQVSKATLNRDLNALEAKGCIHKVHGGVLSNEQSLSFELPLPEKEGFNRKKKEKIAMACLNEVHDGDVIILDSGSTMYYFAKQLADNKTLKEVTVLTNDIKVAYTLCSNPNLTLIVLGGQKRQDAYDLYGPTINHVIANLSVTTYFMATSAFDLEAGVTHMDYEDVMVKAMMSDSSRRIILCADSSKEAKVKRWKVCEISRLEKIVTDSEIAQEKAEAYREQGVEMVLVD